MISIAMLALSAAAAAQTPASVQSTGESARPRLIVLIVVDQLRGDLLDRFTPYFCGRGFRRLMNDGAWFTSAYYSHGANLTGPGHACVSAGCNPREHGISANDDLAGECSVDSRYPVVGLESKRRAAKGASAERMKAPALGEIMKSASGGRALVASVGLKRRSVVLLAGRKADRVYWYEGDEGRFVTSRAYSDSLAPCMASLNRERYADRWFGKKWTRLLPDSAYANCAPDDDLAEWDRQALGRTFPHTIDGGLKKPGPKFYTAVETSPYGNDLVLEAAGRLLEHEPLGRDDVCDLLCIALSSNDLVGHLFGPDSHEVMDMTVRTDRQIASLLDSLDRRIGRGRFVVALTADHGITPIPSRSKDAGQDAGLLDESRVRDALNAAIRLKVGVADAKWRGVADVAMPWAYFDRAAIAKANLDAARVQEICVEACRNFPGVARAYSAVQLAGPLPTAVDDGFRMAWQAYHPDMAGEVYIQLKPWWQKSDNAASHGSLQPCDRHVPILLYGPGVRSGKYVANADPIDIAPTLCALLGQPHPRTMTGRVLDEALAPLTNRTP